MKCTRCHTHLPEFGKFQKKICPNCGNPVNATNTVPSPPKRTAAPHSPTDHNIQKVEKARDAVVWDILIELFSFFLIIISFAMIEREGSNLPFLVFLYGVLSMGIASLPLPYLLLRAIRMRRLVPKYLRPDFLPVYRTLIIGAISAVLVFILSFGIHQRINYSKNEHRFVEVEAIITEIFESGTGDDIDYDVYISYDFDGKTYDIEYPKHNSSMDEGDLISIKIDPEYPGRLPQKGTALIIVSAILTSISLSALYLIVINPLILRVKSRKQNFSSV